MHSLVKWFELHITMMIVAASDIDEMRVMYKVSASSHAVVRVTIQCCKSKYEVGIRHSLLFSIRRSCPPANGWLSRLTSSELHSIN